MHLFLDVTADRNIAVFCKLSRKLVAHRSINAALKMQ